MVERGHRERFDRVIQILIIVEALLVEYTWTMVPTVGFLVLFIAGLCLWAWGELGGGEDEYFIKTISFWAIVNGLLILSFICAISLSPVPLSFAMITLGITLPLVSLGCSIEIASYLGELRPTFLLTLIVLTVLYPLIFLSTWMFIFAK